MGPSIVEPTVIVVDNDDAVRASLKFSLELEGYHVETHDSGEAVAARRDLPPQACLVLDYALPGIDGLQLLRALRARSINLPAIIITTQPNRMLRAAAAAAGVPIVEKPLISNALILMVQRAFEGSGESSEPRSASIR